MIRQFFSAFSSTVHIDVGKIVSQIHLVNRKEKAPLFSSACTANAAEEAFRPQFLCPLARASEHVIPELDLAAMQVLFSVKGSRKTHVCFRVYGRKDRAPRVDLRLSHEQIEERRAALDIAPPDTYEDTPVLLAAADVFSPEDWASLSWEDSPYQLVVAPCGEEDEPDLLTASWTYFQIPCAWDVDIVEAFANERLILMGDRLTSLGSVKGATVEPRTKETNATMELSAEEQSLISLAMRGLGGKQTGFSNHLTNAIVEREDGRFFAMTSWASMVVLKRSRKTGNYYAHSLYYHSTSRALYVLRRGAMDLAEALREDTERLEALGREIAEARAAASEETGDVGTREGEVRLARQALDKEAGYLHDLETTERELRGEGRIDLAKAYEGPLVDQRKKVAERSKALEEAFLKLELARDRHRARMEEIDESIAPLREEEEERRRKIREGGAVLQEWSILREPVAIVDGTADFDYSSTPSPGWCQISFEEDELPLTHAITSGISSCAGGVTFTVNDGSPDVILFWHVDASPTVPVKDVIAELYPDLEKCPALRSIVSIHPSVAEMNKYRKDNMYPRSIRDRCETVFLARGSHLYDELSAVVCGSDDFGVDVTDPDNVCLVFTNDMDKRTYTEKTVDSRTESGLSIGLCDHRANIYGDYRFKGKPIDDTSALKSHLARLFTAEVSEVTAHKAKHAKVCRLTGLGSDLFDALQSAPTCFTVLASPCFALGAKGDLEIGHGSPKSHYWWRPGPVLPPESKDEKEKEKGGEKDEKEKEKEKGGDEMPPKKPVLEPAGRGPHSLRDEEVEEWCHDNCHMCGRSPVRARYSCSPRCPNHHVKLCVPCGSGITMKTCSTCGTDVEIWDMSHNEPWR